MKLIVGLGNPGKEYENTRHNVGFMVIDNYLKKCNESKKEKYDGIYYELNINNEKVIFLKPCKYINLSGEVVKRFVNYYNIDIDDILIINDDLDLDLGRYKLRPKGSSAGHNGLKNIELNLKSESFKRLKIGISNNKLIDTKDYVLGKFSNEEKEILSNVIDISKDIIDDYLKYSFDKLMAMYNKKQ